MALALLDSSSSSSSLLSSSSLARWKCAEQAKSY